MYSSMFLHNAILGLVAAICTSAIGYRLLCTSAACIMYAISYRCDFSCRARGVRGHAV